MKNHAVVGARANSYAGSSFSARTHRFMGNRFYLTALSLTLLGLFSATGSMAARDDTVRVSIEGKEFRVHGEVLTQVQGGGEERRVETGQTSNGTPVVITRLSKPSRSEGESAQVADTAHPVLIHAITPHSVSIAWSGDRSTVYSVSRDGQPIAQTSDGGFVDESVSPSTTYQYLVEAVTTSGLDQGQATSATFSITTPATSGLEGDGTSSPSVATKTMVPGGPSQTIYTRRTFIPDERVASGLLGDIGCLTPGQDVAYKGDNRGWDETGNWNRRQSRTVIRLRADWRKPLARLVSGIWVSPTTRYINGKEETRQAEPNSGWLRSYIRRKDYVEVNLHHDIGNPFCFGNSIWYEERVSMWNDGTVLVMGSRRKAPRHEAVVSYYVPVPLLPKGPITLFQLENEGFHCLAPLACGANESYRHVGVP